MAQISIDSDMQIFACSSQWKDVILLTYFETRMGIKDVVFKFVALNGRATGHLNLDPVARSIGYFT